MCMRPFANFVCATALRSSIYIYLGHSCHRHHRRHHRSSLLICTTTTPPIRRYYQYQQQQQLQPFEHASINECVWRAKQLNNTLTN
jgi:hypothetical protein